MAHFGGFVAGIEHLITQEKLLAGHEPPAAPTSPTHGHSFATSSQLEQAPNPSPRHRSIHFDLYLYLNPDADRKVLGRAVLSGAA